MNLLKTGLNLTNAVRSAGRFSEIVSILAKNGLRELILKSGLHQRIPGFVLPNTKVKFEELLSERSNNSWSSALGFMLRTSFEELGPGFIKLGQLIATREDLLDPDLIRELKPLQDNVKGIPIHEARTIIERALGGPISEFFSAFDESPLGTASIGVVFAATLKDGTEVVIKVRRPGIGQIIKRDVRLFATLIEQLGKVSPEIKSLGLSRVLDDFAHHLELELDYRIEAQNMRRMADAFAMQNDNKVLGVPQPIDHLVREEVIVMQRVLGIRFNETELLKSKRDELNETIISAVRIFASTLLTQGIFHADLHGGNLFLTPENKISLIDFGLVGTLSQSSRRHLVAMLYALFNGSEEQLVSEFLDVAEYDHPPDVAALTRDVRDAIRPYLGLTLSQMDAGKILKSVMLTLTEHNIYLPRDWFLVFRALITLDGLGKSIGIDFDLMKILSEDVKNIFSTLISKEQLMNEAAFFARDALSAARDMPRHIKWFLRDFSKNGYKLEIKQSGYENNFKTITRALYSLGFFLTFCCMTVAGLWAHIERNKGIINTPLIEWMFWCLSIFFLFGSAWQIRRPRDL